MGKLPARLRSEDCRLRCLPTSEGTWGEIHSVRRHGTQGRTRLTAARSCEPKVLAKARKDVFDIGEPKAGTLRKRETQNRSPRVCVASALFGVTNLDCVFRPQI